MKKLLILALLLVACRPPNSFVYKYMPTQNNWKNYNMGEKYGARIGTLSQDTYWINYDFVFDLHYGNYERNYYLLRCAELAKELGFEYFIILVENRDKVENTSGQMIIQCFQNKPSKKDLENIDKRVTYNVDIIISDYNYLYDGKKAYLNRFGTRLD